jgi:23S rRNA (uracil1939-C5)-methyltransferase
LVGEHIQLRIEKMAVGGAGLGRHNGLVVFVDYAAPGDLLQVEITEEKKNLSFAKIVKVLESAEERIQAPCIYFGECGGCSWQHLSKKEQLRQKQQIVEDSLKEIQKINPFTIRPIISSPLEFNYRNRIQVTSLNQTLNFRKKHSHDFVQIKDCLLVEEPLKKVLKNPPKNLKNNVRYDLRVNEDGAASLTPLDEEVELVGFSQVNRFQNQELIGHVLAAIKKNSDGDLFEFYAGSGNFTFPLFNQKFFSRVFAVEGSPVLVKKANEQIQKENISSKKLSFHLGDVSQFLKTHWPSPNDTVFLDPPRVGADDFAIKTLALSKPRQIVYLSCHPVTLCRDLKRLLSYESSYNIDFAQAFEMFPQTDHVEVLVSISRS